MRKALWLVLIVLVAAAPAFGAPEQRCTDLGANCLCSEPFQNTTAPEDVASAYFNPNDTTTLQCGIDGVTGAALVGEPGNTFGGTEWFSTTASGTNLPSGSDATMFARLPSAHANTRVIRNRDGNVISWFAGHSFASASTVRRALRVYLYISPITTFTEDVGPGVCNNVGKLTQLTRTAGPTITLQGGGGYNMYGFLGPADGVADGWNLRSLFPGFDCCTPPPGKSAGANQATSFFKGKWWRVEIVATNVRGTPTAFKIFMQDVTTVPNPAELTILDMASTCSNCTNGGGTAFDWTSSVGSQARLIGGGTESESIVLDLFRCWGVNAGCGGSSVGPCAGHFGLTHMMAAAWSTNAGQRIGAATEIEGGGSPTPPTAPSNLRIVELLYRWLAMLGLPWLARA